MKKKKRSIHDLIKEKFGSNILPDERFSSKSYTDWRAFNITKKVDEDEPIWSDPRAEPDILPENAGVWYPSLNERQEDQLDSIEEAWESLTEREKRAVVLATEGLSLKRIADRLGIELKGADSLIRRARQKVKNFHRRKSAIREHKRGAIKKGD